MLQRVLDPCMCYQNTQVKDNKQEVIVNANHATYSHKEAFPPLSRDLRHVTATLVNFTVGNVTL
jgi:hypothetical protein